LNVIDSSGKKEHSVLKLKIRMDGTSSAGSEEEMGNIVDLLVGLGRRRFTTPRLVQFNRNDFIIKRTPRVKKSD